MSNLFGWFDKRDFIENSERQQNSFTTSFGFGNTNVRRCTSTRDCASGYACINGVCQRVNVPSGTSEPNDPGSCTEGTGGTSPCGEVGACSDGGNCGSGSPVSSCCGQAVSYVTKNEEGKFVPTCDKPRTCRPFCTNYYASFGRMPAGCEGYNPCFADCEICGVSGGAYSCQKKLISESSPCYCDNGARCGPCDQCVIDTGSSDLGQCVPNPGAPETSRCQQCLELPTYQCGNGVEIGPIEACTEGDKTAAQVLVEKIQARCAACTVLCHCHEDCPDGMSCTANGCV